MMDFLKDHPFSVNAFFKSSSVLAFAVPKEELIDRIPPCLTLDLFNDQWAFLAVAMVQTTDLRPAGFPKFMGNDFFLIGYRVFVQYHTNAGKRLRGLYILKSETDTPKMETFGNTFTRYNYTTIDISQKRENNKYEIESEKGGLKVEFDLSEDAALPQGSPFTTWKEARRFAGPLPFTFTYKAEKKEVMIIEGVRQNWTPRPIKVVNHEVQFIRNLGLKDVVLANAFIIENIPYKWKKGRKEIWTP